MSSPISFLVPCGIIAAVSIPLMLNLVPPNDAYGFRTKRTLSSPAVWYRANRFAGTAFFIAAGVSAAAFIARPEYASGSSLAGLGILVVPLVVAVLASLVYVRRIGDRPDA